jgi:hypothetical protein
VLVLTAQAPVRDFFQLKVLSFPKIISERIGDAAYTDQPSGMQVVVYAITLLIIYSLTRLLAPNRPRHRTVVVV